MYILPPTIEICGGLDAKSVPTPKYGTVSTSVPVPYSKTELENAYSGENTLVKTKTVKKQMLFVFKLNHSITT